MKIFSWDLKWDCGGAECCTSIEYSIKQKGMGWGAYENFIFK